MMRYAVIENEPYDADDDVVGTFENEYEAREFLKLLDQPERFYIYPYQVFGGY